MRRENIYCPECARLIYKYDGKSTMDIDLRCECGRYYNFNPQRHEVIQIKRPERTTASGVRFY